MNGVMRSVVVFFAFWLGTVNAVMAEAKSEAEAKTPHQVIENVTEQMLTMIKEGEKALKEDPDAYYARVESILEPVVSFGFISKNVMASHWAKASEEQREQFESVFRRGMVETLAKGMANYSDLDVSVVPPAEDISGQKRLEVLQEIKGNDGVNRVSYTMAQNKSGEWKLINVVLNGVNLGKSFRDQFAQAVKQNGGDLDKVIKTWSQKS